MLKFVTVKKSVDALMKEIKEKERQARRERERRERMNFERNRLDSFPSWWSDEYQLDVSVAQRLAKAGFCCSFGSIKCFSCGLWKDPTFWKQHDPETVHREERPNCKFVTGQSDNVPIGLSVLRRFQIFISNTFKQNKEIEQQDYNHTKLRSENQQLKAEQITKNENPDEKQKKHNINFITKPSLPSVSKCDKPQEDKFTKTNQNRPTKQRTGFWGDVEEILGSKRQASGTPEVIHSTSSPPGAPFTSNGNHTAQNVHQTSVAVSRSSFPDGRVEQLTKRRRRRDDRDNTATTHQESEKKIASGPIKERTLHASRSWSSDVGRNKSATTSRGHQELMTSEPSSDVARAWNIGNAVITDSDDSDVSRIKPQTTRRKHFTSKIPCSTVSLENTFKSSVYSLIAN